MKTFSSLNHLNPEVVYPTPDFLAFEDAKLKSSDCFDANSEKLIFLSINRYERKKNLALALRAFSMFIIYYHYFYLLFIIIHYFVLFIGLFFSL